MQIAVGTVVGTAVMLAVGGTMAGIQSAKTGHGFWEAFAEHVSENATDALITSFAMSAVSVAASNIVKCFQCFKEGTLVETEEGLKPIEEIREGDKVLAYDEATGEQTYKPVVQLFRNTTNEWYHVYAGGEDIICTGGHPFYVVNAEAERRVVQFEGNASDGKGAWICANELKVCDKVLLSDGTTAIIEAVEVEKLSNPEITYNFEVAEAHTYYVSDSKVLVHNKCGVQTANKAKVHGKAHGLAEHQIRIMQEVEAMQASGKYSDIYLNAVKFLQDMYFK